MRATRLDKKGVIINFWSFRGFNHLHLFRFNLQFTPVNLEKRLLGKRLTPPVGFGLEVLDLLLHHRFFGPEDFDFRDFYFGRGIAYRIFGFFVRFGCDRHSTRFEVASLFCNGTAGQVGDRNRCGFNRHLLPGQFRLQFLEEFRLLNHFRFRLFRGLRVREQELNLPSKTGTPGPGSETQPNHVFMPAVRSAASPSISCSGRGRSRNPPGHEHPEIQRDHRRHEQFRDWTEKVRIH